MQKSAISWTTVTWNPVHGCSRVSEGCRHCYAERISLDKGFTKLPWTAQNAEQNVGLKPHKLNEPLKVKEASRIFVNSMSDLFHPLIPDAYIRQIFDVMNRCPQHIFQILTKRPERAAVWEYGWSDHIWMGTSIENQKALTRLDAIRNCPAKVRFVSAEPLLEPLTGADLTGIHWLIVGGESGTDFRKMPHAWARELRDICRDYETAFFFKQSAAYRTELGTSLRHIDGSFWTWHQWPGDLAEPEPANAHQFTYE